jgi:hypothetical protein
VGGDSIVMLLEEPIVTVPAAKPVGQKRICSTPSWVALLAAVSIVRDHVGDRAVESISTAG